MTGGDMGYGRILERKPLVTCLEKQGGRMCKTKHWICDDDKKEWYKGMRGDKLYQIKIAEECRAWMRKL